jgi:hypothetical protein
MHEFTPVISCIWFRSHAKIRQRILSFRFWINAIFATFSLRKFLESYQGYPSTKLTTPSAKARMGSCHHGARIAAPDDSAEPFCS